MGWIVGWMYVCGMCLAAIHLNNILQVRWHRWMKVAFWPFIITSGVIVSVFPKG